MRSAIIWALLAFTGIASANELRRVSVSSTGVQGNGDSGSRHISANGRFVVFDSDASNLVEGDTNGVRDVFLHDRQTGATERVSLGDGRVQANNFATSEFLGGSVRGSVSADGRWVAFQSMANNLVFGDTNDIPDAFVFDRLTGSTRRVSVSSSGEQMAVGFEGTVGPYGVRSPKISDDGSHVLFVSTSSNLVPGDTNGVFDVFVYQLQTATTVRASIASNGLQGNGSSGFSALLGLAGAVYVDISGNGRRVVFLSRASTFLSGDTNQTFDVFWKDLDTGQMVRVNSTAQGGWQTQSSPDTPRLSADGLTVVFQSPSNEHVLGDDNNREDVFVRTLPSGPLRIVNRTLAGGLSYRLSSDQFMSADVSADGRFVSFLSIARDLVAGTTLETPRIYLRDLQLSRTHLLDGRREDDLNSTFGNEIALASDATALAFDSNASYFVPGDSNGRHDVFVRSLPNLADRGFADGFESGLPAPNLVISRHSPSLNPSRTRVMCGY